jgi:adenosine deaminase
VTGPTGRTDHADHSHHSEPTSYARLPKADLHCHLVGTIALETVLELARRDGATWDPPPEQVYAAIGSLPPAGFDYRHTAVPMTPAPPGTAAGHSLLAVTEQVEDLLHEREDFARIGYEAVTAAYRDSGTVHLELQVELGAYLRRGVAYADVVDGLGEGLVAARAETGTSALLIAAIDRSRSAAEALQVVQEVVDHPRDHVVGIGLDNLETAGPPERFADAFDLAGRHGLRRTAHAGEHEPTARNVATCLDRLGCERIDHGYFVLEDDDLVKRVAGEGIPFTCISTTSRRAWQDWRRASINRMVDAGVAVVLASDDPAMFPTTLAREYAIAAAEIGLDAATLVQVARRSLDAAWVDDDRKRAMLAQLDTEVEAVLRGATAGGTERDD